MSGEKFLAELGREEHYRAIQKEFSSCRPLLNKAFAASPHSFPFGKHASEPIELDILFAKPPYYLPYPTMLDDKGDAKSDFLNILYGLNFDWVVFWVNIPGYAERLKEEKFNVWFGDHATNIDRPLATVTVEFAKDNRIVEPSKQEWSVFAVRSEHMELLADALPRTVGAMQSRISIDIPRRAFNILEDAKIWVKKFESWTLLGRPNKVVIGGLERGSNYSTPDSGPSKHPTTNRSYETLEYLWIASLLSLATWMVDSDDGYGGNTSNLPAKDDASVLKCAMGLSTAFWLLSNSPTGVSTMNRELYSEKHTIFRALATIASWIYFQILDKTNNNYDDWGDKDEVAEQWMKYALDLSDCPDLRPLMETPQQGMFEHLIRRGWVFGLFKYHEEEVVNTLQAATLCLRAIEKGEPPMMSIADMKSRLKDIQRSLDISKEHFQRRHAEIETMIDELNYWNRRYKLDH